MLVEDLSGEVQCAENSAKENLNVDELLSKIMLQLILIGTHKVKSLKLKLKKVWILL